MHDSENHRLVLQVGTTKLRDSLLQCAAWPVLTSSGFFGRNSEPLTRQKKILMIHKYLLVVRTVIDRTLEKTVNYLLLLAKHLQVYFQDVKQSEKIF